MNTAIQSHRSQAAQQQAIETALRRECEDAVNDTFGFTNASDYYWSAPRGLAEDIVNVAYGVRCDHCPGEEPEVKDVLTAVWDYAFASEAAFHASSEHETAVRFCIRCLAELLSQQEEAAPQEEWTGAGYAHRAASGADTLGIS